VKKVNEIKWQSLSLKKDIELKGNRAFQEALLTQIIIMILGIVLPGIFNFDEFKYYWIILLGLCLISLLKTFICWKIKKNELLSGIMEPRIFIDAFNNEIVEYVLTLESYYTMLTKALSNNNNHANTISKDMIHFYYIQTSTFFQKTITALSSINNIAPEVLSLDKDDAVIYGLIPFSRYKNINSLLKTIYEYLEVHKNIIDELDRGELIIELNKTAKNNLDTIDISVSDSFKNKALNGVK
jgi:hypothetical protein